MRHHYFKFLTLFTDITQMQSIGLALLFLIILTGCTTENGITLSFSSSNTPKVSLALSENIGFTNQRLHTLKIDANIEVTEMTVQVGQACSSIWIPYKPTHQIELSTVEGKQNIFVQTRTADGFESKCESMSIVYDISPPQFSDAPTLATNISLTDITPLISATRAFDSISPIAGYELQLEDASSGSVIIASTSKAADDLRFTGLTLPDSSTPYRYQLKAIDAAGNSAVRTSGLFEVGPFVSIEAGSNYNNLTLGTFKIKLSRPTNKQVAVSVLSESRSALNGIHYYYPDFVPSVATVTSGDTESSVMFGIYTGRYQDGSTEKIFNLKIQDISNAINASSTTYPVAIQEMLAPLAGVKGPGFTALSGNTYQYCAIKNGEVYCWGRSEISDEIRSQGERVFHQKSDFVSLSKGSQFFCAIDSIADAFCWSSFNFSGELGFPLGTNTSSGVGNKLLPVPVSGGIKFTKIATNNQSACGISTTQKLYCWGQFNITGTLVTSDTPVEITQVPNPVDVSGYMQYTCALNEVSANNREVLCWGFFPSITSQMAISKVNDLPSNLTEISVSASLTRANGEYGCALTTDKNVYCWGDNKTMRLGFEGATTDRRKAYLISGLPSDIEKVIAGEEAGCAISTGRGFLCWGTGYFPQPGVVGPNATPFNPEGAPSGALADGTSLAPNSCFLQKSSRISCIGNGFLGQLSQGYSPSGSNFLWDTPFPIYQKATQVISGLGSSCLLGLDKKVRCWGANIFYNHGTGDSSTNYTVSREVVGLTNIKEISGSLAAICALAENGDVYCWGDNRSAVVDSNVTNGALDLTKLAIATPVKKIFPAGVGATSISVRFQHACSVGTDELVYCWGSNSSGQLGRPTSIPALVLPELVGGLTEVKQVQTGATATCAVTADRDLYCWGNSAFHLNATNTHIPQFVRTIEGAGPIVLSLGNDMGCYTTDGDLYCWGTPVLGLPLGNTMAKGVPTKMLYTEADGTPLYFQHVSVGTMEITARTTSFAIRTYNFFIQNLFYHIGLGTTELHLDAKVSHQCKIGFNNEVFCSGPSIYGESSSEFYSPVAIEIQVEP